MNSSKCSFVKKEISFWGMVYGADGIKPDPAKVEALEHIAPPCNKEELITFLCMIQSNADFIPNFAQRSAHLCHRTKGKVQFNWQDQHQPCFEELRYAFRKDSLLRYFDMGKLTFIFTDAHILELGAMLWSVKVIALTQQSLLLLLLKQLLQLSPTRFGSSKY